MTNSPNYIEFICPYCKKLRNVGINPKKLPSAVRSSNGDLDDANVLIDLPKCLGCKREYQYNLRTREVVI
jgi:phage FluMu protein Com